MNAEEILFSLIELITNSLEELKSYSQKNQFVYGEKTAYVECLELIQLLGGSSFFKPNYNIQKKYL